MRAGPAVARMADFDLAGRRVLVRADLNVPLAGGKVANAARIRASLPTFEQALAAGAALTVVSHLGRPAAGCFDPALSMAPVAARLGEALGRPVPVAAGWPDEGPVPAPGELALAENVRFLAGETENDEALARRMAATCDVFVMDAFGTAHRAHASTAGVVCHAPAACAGPLLAAELAALGQALDGPARPVVAVVGGAKVAGKIELLENLAEKVDRLIVGGGIANTFLAAAGLPVGASLVDGERVAFAARLLARAAAKGFEIVLPGDVVVAAELSADAVGVVKPVGEVGGLDRILDIGPRERRTPRPDRRRGGHDHLERAGGCVRVPAVRGGDRASRRGGGGEPRVLHRGRRGYPCRHRDLRGVGGGIADLDRGRGVPRVPRGPEAPRGGGARGGAGAGAETGAESFTGQTGLSRGGPK